MCPCRASLMRSEGGGARKSPAGTRMSAWGDKLSSAADAPHARAPRRDSRSALELRESGRRRGVRTEVRFAFATFCIPFSTSEYTVFGELLFAQRGFRMYTFACTAASDLAEGSFPKFRVYPKEALAHGGSSFSGKGRHIWLTSERYHLSKHHALELGLTARTQIRGMRVGILGVGITGHIRDTVLSFYESLV